MAIDHHPHPKPPPHPWLHHLGQLLVKFQGEQAKYIHTHAVDGGALAGSRKYDELTTKKIVPVPMKSTTFTHCGFHCNALSSKEGLGMSKRVVNEN
jgi:hypothetical protein